MQKKIVIILILTLINVFMNMSAIAWQPTKVLGLQLQGYAYPYPVKNLMLNIQGKHLQMAYMDVPASGKSRHETVVLLHGGLLFSAYWQQTIRYLSQQGFRVIVPDQIGFGKSSKEPVHLSFQLLASNTKQLLDHLGVQHVSLVGHSFGGMLALRYSLMYPSMVNKLVLEDPLGLEDYRLKIPYKSIEEIMELASHPTWSNILNSHKALYRQWDQHYAEYTKVIYGVTLNKQYSKIAEIQALIYDMIYTQPIVYELSNIKTPTLIVFGSEDHTAPGKGFASIQQQATLGNFPVLVQSVIKKMPSAKMIELQQVGHTPHLEATLAFNKIVTEFLTTKV